MMISPESYKKLYEKEKLEKLVLERTKLFNEIVEYEQKHIINNEPEEVVKPSPKDIYNMHNLYLKEITDLIIDKTFRIQFDFYKKKDEEIKPIRDNQREIYSIAESIYKEIEKLPIDSEFKIGQFFKDSDINEKEKLDLCEQVISYCLVNNVKVVEKMPDADLGLPWNIPRIRK